MKILHIASDDKFIDQALLVFEEAFPNSNTLLLYSAQDNIKYVRSNIDYKIKVGALKLKLRLPKINESIYDNCDLVIFHSLSDSIYSDVFRVPNRIPIIWFGWGYDYYDLLPSDSSWVLPKTQKLLNKSQIGRRGYVRKFTSKLVKTIEKKLVKISAIHRISVFAPVLLSEYAMLKGVIGGSKFPKEGDWNYGTLEDHLVKGFESEWVVGSDIMVGNSASANCNHVEAFELIKEVIGDRARIIAPLSYGDVNYANEVDVSGRRIFGRDFESLREFLPIEEYIQKLKSCGFVVMNHRRQQALGNIVIMLYLGARVFLRAENPTYAYLKEQGFSISTVEELQTQPELIRLPLSLQERAANRKRISNVWGRQRALIRTKAIVEMALNINKV